MMYLFFSDNPNRLINLYHAKFLLISIKNFPLDNKKDCSSLSLMYLNFIIKIILILILKF